jgi:hypothetical protein
MAGNEYDRRRLPIRQLLVKFEASDVREFQIRHQARRKIGFSNFRNSAADPNTVTRSPIDEISPDKASPIR